MSTNHHTPIVPGAPAAASTFNTPLGELDSAISALIAGAGGLDVLRLIAQTAEMVGSEAARAASLLTIKAPSPATAATLTKLTGGSNGDLVLLTAHTGHAITIEHGAGADTFSLNMLGSAAGKRTLTDKTFLLFVRVGAQWWEVPTSLELASYAGSASAGARPLRAVLPSRALTWTPNGSNAHLHVTPGMAHRQWFSIRGVGTALVPVAAPAPTVQGTASSSSDSDGDWITLTSGATAGNAGGFSGDSGQTRYRLNPVFDTVIKTNNITNVRIWIGLFTTAPGNVDAYNNGSIGFRFSTVAGDVNWQGVIYGSSTLTLYDTGVPVLANTKYKLGTREYEDGMYFTVNDVPVAPFTIPGGADAITSLMPVVRVVTTTANARTIWFTSFHCDHD